jgi:hypothetical protein
MRPILDSLTRTLGSKMFISCSTISIAAASYAYYRFKKAQARMLDIENGKMKAKDHALFQHYPLSSAKELQGFG